MKLVIAVVQDHDVERLSHALTDRQYRVTRLASTGGFLRAGNTTLLVGVDDAQVDQVTGLIKQTCEAREKLVTPMSPMGGPPDSYVAMPTAITVGGATVFVVDVDRFARF